MLRIFTDTKDSVDISTVSSALEHQVLALG